MSDAIIVLACGAAGVVFLAIGIRHALADRRDRRYVSALTRGVATDRDAELKSGRAMVDSRRRAG